MFGDRCEDREAEMIGQRWCRDVGGIDDTDREAGMIGQRWVQRC
jgi:hypothetical protein